MDAKTNKTQQILYKSIKDMRSYYAANDHTLLIESFDLDLGILFPAEGMVFNGACCGASRLVILFLFISAASSEKQQLKINTSHQSLGYSIEKFN